MGKAADGRYQGSPRAFGPSHETNRGQQRALNKTWLSLDVVSANFSPRRRAMEAGLGRIFHRFWTNQIRSRVPLDLLGGGFEFDRFRPFLIPISQEVGTRSGGLSDLFFFDHRQFTFCMMWISVWLSLQLALLWLSLRQHQGQKSKRYQKSFTRVIEQLGFAMPQAEAPSQMSAVFAPFQTYTTCYAR